MAVADENKIDFASVDNPTNTAFLNMEEPRPWSKIEPTWKELMSKLNFYIGACKDPEFSTHFPETKGRRLAIRLLCHYVPDNPGLHAISLAKAACDHFEIPFSAFRVSEGTLSPIQIPVPPPGSVTVGSSAAPKPWWRFW